MVKIKKRDGSTEDYDRKKFLNSLIRAQLTPDQAQNVLGRVENWLLSDNQQIITSSQLRDKTLEFIEAINKDAAHAYRIYRKSQEEKEI
jgi:2-phosphoglycerate kinase